MSKKGIFQVGAVLVSLPDYLVHRIGRVQHPERDGASLALPVKSTLSLNKIVALLAEAKEQGMAGGYELIDPEGHGPPLAHKNCACVIHFSEVLPKPQAFLVRGVPGDPCRDRPVQALAGVDHLHQAIYLRARPSEHYDAVLCGQQILQEAHSGR